MRADNSTHNRSSVQSNSQKRLRKYEKAGMSGFWCDRRLQSVTVRNGFTATLAAHDVNRRKDFRNITGMMTRIVIGQTPTKIREDRQIPQSQSTRDSFDDVELAAMSLAESLSSRQIDVHDASGPAECSEICSTVCRSVATTVATYAG